MVFDYENASRAELIEYLIKEHRQPFEMIEDNTDEELRVLASIGGAPEGEMKWHHQIPFALILVSLIQLFTGNPITALIVFVLSVLILFIMFSIDKNHKMKTYYNLKEKRRL